MKHISIRLMALILLVFVLSLAMFGCGKNSDPLTITLTADSGITALPRGSSVQLNATCSQTPSGAITYEVVSGAASVNQNGLLTVNADAAVNSEVKVVAKADGQTSPTLTLKVLGTTATAITVTAPVSTISVGAEVNISVQVTPSDADNVSYTLAVVGGDDIATITPAGVLSLKDGLNEGDIVNRKIKVQATLDANNSVVGTLELTVVRDAEVDSIALRNIDWIAGVSAAPAIYPVAYNASGFELTSLEPSDFSYTCDTPAVLEVSSDGRITPKAHGTALVTVRYKDVEAKCRVTVIVPPQALKLDGYNQHILTTGGFSYGKGDALALSVLASHFQYGCSDALSYAFVCGDLSGDDVASVDENGNITFKVNGKVDITVTTNSSLSGIDTSVYEKSLKVTINVNDGFNADSVADLLAYANQSSNITVNLVSDIFLTATDNFGTTKDEGGTKDVAYATLSLEGNRIFNGNGYTISLDQLPVRSDFRHNRVNLLEFNPDGVNPYYHVEVRDLTLIGSGGITGIANNSANNNIPVVYGLDGDESNPLYLGSYGIALRIHGVSYDDIYNLRAYVKDPIVDNVTIKGFEVGMRLDHTVNGKISNTFVDDCYSNGIELCQNLITLQDIEFGRVGAFAIEAVPDDMKEGPGNTPPVTSNSTTTTPHGTAGADYNRTQTIRFSGNIVSRNINNGATHYMVNDFNKDLAAMGGTTVPALAQGIMAYSVQAMAQAMGVAGDQAKMGAALSVLTECFFLEDGTSMNFYFLMYVDPTKYIGYQQGGNTEGRFCQFQYDGFEDMLNVNDIIGYALDNDPSNDNLYKDEKFLTLDLMVPMGPVVLNVGQIILVNSAYEGN